MPIDCHCKHTDISDLMSYMSDDEKETVYDFLADVVSLTDLGQDEVLKMKSRAFNEFMKGMEAQYADDRLIYEGVA